MSEASKSSTLSPAKETSGGAVVFSVRQLIRNPEAMPRQAFLDLLGRTWRQMGFEPTSFARDFLKYPPTQVVLVSTVTSDGATKLERKAIVKGINYEPLDLHRLYCEVWKLGGFRNVTEKGDWQLVAVACNFLKAEGLGKALVGGATTSKQLDPSQRRIVINTSNTYERYLFQFELRMAHARRTLAAQARQPLNRFHGCHYLHSIGGLAEDSNSTTSHKPSDNTAVPPALMTGRGVKCSRVRVFKPTMVHARIESKPLSQPGAGSREECHKAIDGASSARPLSGEVEDRGKIPTRAVAAQPSEFLRRQSSAAQLTGILGQKEPYQQINATDPGHQFENREASGDTLTDFIFSNFAWVEKEIASPSPSGSSEAMKDYHSTDIPWYWAAEAQQASANSTKATLSDCAIQIPDRQEREHIVPEKYWAREGDRLGIRPVEPKDRAAIDRGFLRLASKWNKASGNRTRKFGLFRRKGVSSRLESYPKMPATDFSGTSFIEMESHMLGSDLSSSYLPVSHQGMKAKMTYRAKVEKYQ
jgi:ARID/BRIGHT DNA binding domain